MTDLEIDSFLYLYASLPNRLPWEPLINSRTNTEKIKSEQLDLQATHRRRLQQRLLDGQIQAFDVHQIPANRIGPNIYITLDQAIEYLKECGIKICKSQTTIESAAPSVQSKMAPATVKRWTDDELKRIFEYHAKWNTPRTAINFKISESLVRRKVAVYRKIISPSRGWGAQLQVNY